MGLYKGIYLLDPPRGMRFRFSERQFRQVSHGRVLKTARKHAHKMGQKERERE